MLHQMPFAPLPENASWQHRGLRTGFEVAYFQDDDGTAKIEGSRGVDGGRGRSPLDGPLRNLPGYDLENPASLISVRSPLGWRSTVLESQGDGSWRVDGAAAPHLDGCLDVDLESSALTNAVPVHRLALAVDERAAAPAAYVRTDLSIERLEQDYLRASDHESHQRYHYAAPAFAFTCSLLYDESGLVLEYPGIATRSS
jgi:hypothetical protein